MSQAVYISSNHTLKLKKDWNEFQHLSTQGRYIEPKVFAGFENQRIKLTTVKKQLYNPRLPTVRQIERDNVLCRLPDEHCRHTTLFTEEQFQNLDPKREESFIEFSGLNWHNTGKALLGIHNSPFIQDTSSMEFGARLRPDKSQTKLYRSSSLLSASLIKPNKYNYRNYISTGYINRPAESLFRSSSMYIDTSASNNTDSSKSIRV